MSNSTNAKVNFDGSVLLDTNILFIYLFGNHEAYQDVVTRLKVAALTSQYFLISQPTLAELNAAVHRQIKENRSSSQDSLFARSFGSMSGINIERQYIAEIEKFLNRNIFRILDKDDVTIDLEAHKYAELEESLRSKIPSPNNVTVHSQVINHDIQLLLTSELLSVPIMTLDQKIINLAKPKFITSLDVPFPFDVETLSEIKIDELVDLAEPIRRLYKKAFTSIRENTQTREFLDKDLQDKEGIFTWQHDVMKELAFELLREQKKSREWQKLAKPSVSETLVWTIAESMLGLIPFPIPTSPVSFFIQTIRYKQVESKFKN